MLSIGAVASAAQGASYYEKDGYYANDDPEHREASAWIGKGAEVLGLSGPVDPDTFRAILEGKVPDGSGTELGKRGGDGEITHRPGRDLTLSAPKSVSIAALVGGDARIVGVHDRAVKATLAWVEKNAVETRVQDPETGRMARVGDQKTVVATFRHDTSRNLDPQLHTHAVLANMVQSEDGKWRTMVNDGLYQRQKLIGAIYRNELAAGLTRLGYDIEKTHADGRFEIAGVSREVIEAFSTRRAEIKAVMEARGLGATADNPRHAERSALMTRATKQEVDRDELRRVWQRQAADLGLDAGSFTPEPGVSPATPDRNAGDQTPAAELGDVIAPEALVTEPPLQPHVDRSAAADAIRRDPAGGRDSPVTDPIPRTGPDVPAADRRAGTEAVAWAMAHLSERAAVFSRADLLAAALSYAPGTLTVEAVERKVAGLERVGTLHAVNLPGAQDSLATDRTVGEERETIALMRAGGAAREGADAALGRPGAAQPGSAHRRSARGGAADPVVKGPGGGGSRAMRGPARPPCSTGPAPLRRTRVGGWWA